MNVYTFTLNLNNAFKGTKKVNGVLVDFGTKPATLELELPVLEAITLKERNIVNPANFIASLILRLDKDEKVKSFVLNSKTIKINREFDAVSQKTETVYYLNNMVLKPDYKVNITDENSSLVTSFPVSELKGAEKVEVPKDFKYTKNVELNEILKINKTPHDFDRKICAKILNAISDSKEILNTNEEFVYLSVYYNRLNKSKIKDNDLVIPVKEARILAGLTAKTENVHIEKLKTVQIGNEVT